MRQSRGYSPIWTKIVTGHSGWHEQIGDRAELDVGFSATEPPPHRCWGRPA